jgi:HPt (histidine-containing phosphotransfer) domain-containing protein
MTSNNPNKEKIEIIIDSVEAIDNFGSETFEENILLFVDEGYNNYTNGIKKAQSERDQASMKMLTHTLKTTSRYMASENFAQVCQGIESEMKSPNWEKTDDLLTDFFYYLDLLYNECIKFYNDFKQEGQRKRLILFDNEFGNGNNNINNNETYKSPNDKLESNGSLMIGENVLNNYRSVNKNFKFSGFNKCKPSIEGENPSVNDRKNNNNYNENDIKNNMLNKESSDNNLLQRKESEYRLKPNTNSNNMKTFPNSYIQKRNSIKVENKNESIVDLNDINNIKNNNFDFQNINNLKSTETLESVNISLLQGSIERNTEIYSRVPDINKADKYSKIFNDASLVCKELDINDIKNSKSCVHNLGVSTPRFQSGNFDIKLTETDLNGNF